MHEAVIADQNLFLVQGDQHHYFVWEECGFKLRSYHHTISTHDTCAVRVSALAGGNFIFPEDIELVSAVYAVTISTPVLKDLEIHLQHCLDISDQRVIKNVSFAVASSVSSTSGYEFHLMDDERFTLQNEYGSIRISSNACYCIVFKKEPSVLKAILGAEKKMHVGNKEEAVKRSQEREENEGNESSDNENVSEEQEGSSTANGGEEDQDQVDSGEFGEEGGGESGEENSNGDESSEKETSDEESTSEDESSETEEDIVKQKEDRQEIAIYQNQIEIQEDESTTNRKKQSPGVPITTDKHTECKYE